MTNTNNDPALRSPETRQHIAAAAASRAAMHAACSINREHTSWEAIEKMYPQVRAMGAENAALMMENNRLRDAAGDVVADLEREAVDLAPLWSMRARRLDEAAEKLRVAMQPNGGK